MRCSKRLVLSSRLAVAIACCCWLLIIGGGEVEGQRTHARQGGPGGGGPPTVRLPVQGTVAGREVFLSRTQRVIQYLGIPYAQPPINELRFAPPVTDPLPTWQGVRNASAHGPSCPQAVLPKKKLHEQLYRRLLPEMPVQLDMDEDCLFLNIYMPDSNRPPEGWPVLVWFHGGDFNTGTPAIWDASVFVTKQKVLVVTVAYRLNILGFFTTTDSESPGNYGMLDQIAALDWVKEYIELFDGSPSNIVIYGHSSGAISVGLHMMSPLSRGKFAKAIAMSGDAINSVRMPKDDVAIVEEIAGRFGCYRKTSDMMKCLRNVEIDRLIENTQHIETWGPIIDADINNSSQGPFLPLHPRDVESDDLYAVPLLTGFTNNEQALAYIESMQGNNADGRLQVHDFEKLIRDESLAAVVPADENSTCELRPELVSEAVLFFYKPHPTTRDQKVLRDRYLDLQTEKNYAAGLTQLAGKVSSHRSKMQAFVYRFDYRARTQAVTRDVPEWAGVPHMFELPFVWGLPYGFGPAGPTVQWNAADKKMADVMMSMFATFARTGNPSLTTIKWEPYQERSPGILIIERNIDMSDNGAVDYQALAFWNEYYPTVLEAATNNCCNVTSSAMALIGQPDGELPEVVVKSAAAAAAAAFTILRYFTVHLFV